jgi:tetratricopeptide (TPR) repeat protein
MTTIAGDYYSTLGVERSATAAELKTAYFSKIREFTPEHHPERYFAIAEAYRVLSNPKRRAEYDERKNMPKGAETLISRALESEADDLESALSDMEAVTKRYPDLEDGWFHYGRLLDKANKHAEAARAFQTAVEQNPRNPRNLVWLGDSERKAGNLTNARLHLKEAIVLDPNRADAYSCLAWSFLDADRDHEALEVVDRGIRADGQVDIQDLPLFIQKVIILSRRNKWEEIVRTLQELDQAVPASDQEARTYVARRLFATLREALEANRLDIASILLDGIEKFDRAVIPDGSAAQTFRANCRSRLARSKLYVDESTPDLVKALVQVWSGDADSKESQELAEKIPYILAADLTARVEEWARARRKHSQALEPLEDRWSAASLRASAIRCHAGRQTSSSSGCATMLVLLASTIVGTLGVLLVMYVP